MIIPRQNRHKRNHRPRFRPIQTVTFSLLPVRTAVNFFRSKNIHFLTPEPENRACRLQHRLFLTLILKTTACKTMLYDYPQYYEAAFSFRDVAWEADFLKQVIDRHAVVPVRTVLEIACGHAPHAGELSRLGYRYVGLDKNPHMLAYAREKWRELNPPPEFIQGDMVSFELPTKVQFAYVMLGSLYLNTDEEMQSHFAAMARCLEPGGLYFLDWCVQFTEPLTRQLSNSVELNRDGINIKSEFNTRLIDAARQLYEEIWTVHVNDHGQEKTLRTVERNRAIFPQEFLLFVKTQTDFRFVGWWEDWDLNRPIKGSAAPTRPLVLLRRK
ncbi:MAG: class I SAM-dependent methyltransferase [Candidatus Zixiibacteriota bacterium]|nr:MAG: class I SAM-dependent methyltransferase [candidate division Zixibacteria bacterium]